MVYGNIDNVAEQSYLDHPVWRAAFDVLRGLTTDHPTGTFPLEIPGCFLKVMQYQTAARETCRYESHVEYVDLQYGISGAELIDWRSTGELTPAGAYDPQNDVQFYGSAIAVATVPLVPRHYAIFYPSDAHRPQVASSVDSRIFKAVIKLKLSYLRT